MKQEAGGESPYSGLMATSLQKENAEARSALAGWRAEKASILRDLDELDHELALQIQGLRQVGESMEEAVKA
ncbi:MAG: hypothetical protein JRN66_06500 [Nitrososphaerota archaeon]|jgi:hypothetical protein|nr:hypothetical protein [Nitrososphaerota archaeon]